MIERNPKQVSIEMKDFETSWCFVKTNLLQHEKLSEIGILIVLAQVALKLTVKFGDRNFYSVDLDKG